MCVCVPFLASHYAFFNLALHLKEIAFFCWENIKSAKFNISQRKKEFNAQAEGKGYRIRPQSWARMGILTRHSNRKSSLKGNSCRAPVAAHLELWSNFICRKLLCLIIKWHSHNNRIHLALESHALQNDGIRFP